MVQCVAFGCSNRQESKIPGVTFHKSLLTSLANGCLIVCKFLFLQVKIWAALLEGIIKLVIPIPEKDLRGEIVLTYNQIKSKLLEGCAWSKHGLEDLITGSGHGIGRELSLRLAKQGCKVIGLDVNEEGNAETYKLAKDLNVAHNVHIYKCNVACREEVHTLVEKVTNEVGEVTILVNNAGIALGKRLEHQGGDFIKKVFDVNVLAQFWMLEVILPQMKKRKSGHIVAISSVLGLVGGRFAVPYCSTKFAVRGLMEALHHELRCDPAGKNIKLTTIYPSAVSTGIIPKKYEKYFPTLVSYLTVERAVDYIVSAIKKEKQDASVPPLYYYIINMGSILPRKCSDLLIDY